MRHFLNIHSLDRDTILHLLADAARLKTAHAHGEVATTLRHKIVAMIFEKPSLRTRVSFESGVTQLGGTSIFIPGGEVGLGVRESIADFTRTMVHYVDCLVLRVFKQETVDGVAKHSSVPVINGLSDTSHPCQALADLLTIQEWFGEVSGKTVVFVGDGNNVARSLAIACEKVGGRFILCRPDGYAFDDDFAAKFRKHVGSKLPEETNDPFHAVKSADVIYTDVWTSMGQEAERELRLKQFAPYQVNAALLAKAPRHVKVLHCLPAHRGEEITNDVIESPASVVFQQAGNRLHAQKAVLEMLLK
ncbi:MAG: ornithine carbamoyltransferase [Planctomycetes bacterium]|nr:ornithine carbamoyltransferase [Planctomycetota bacterium]